MTAQTPIIAPHSLPGLPCYTSSSHQQSGSFSFFPIHLSRITVPPQLPSFLSFLPLHFLLSFLYLIRPYICLFILPPLLPPSFLPSSYNHLLRPLHLSVFTPPSIPGHTSIFPFPRTHNSPLCFFLHQHNNYHSSRTTSANTTPLLLPAYHTTTIPTPATTITRPPRPPQHPHSPPSDQEVREGKSGQVLRGSM